MRGLDISAADPAEGSLGGGKGWQLRAPPPSLAPRVAGTPLPRSPWSGFVSVVPGGGGGAGGGTRGDSVRIHPRLPRRLGRTLQHVLIL